MVSAIVLLLNVFRVSLWVPIGPCACPGLQCQVRCASRRLVIRKMPSNLYRTKEKMPSDVHGGVEQRGGENRAGLAPRPAVEKTGDGGQDHIAPVGKAHVGDVGEAKENGSGPPASEFTMRGARKHVLKQAAE